MVGGGGRWETGEGRRFLSPSKGRVMKKNVRKRGRLTKKISHHDLEVMLQSYVVREYKPYMKIMTCN